MRSCVAAAVSALIVALSGCGSDDNSTDAKKDTTMVTTMAPNATTEAFPPYPVEKQGERPFCIPDGVEILNGSLMAVVWCTFTGVTMDGRLEAHRWLGDRWTLAGFKDGYGGETFVFDDQLFLMEDNSKVKAVSRLQDDGSWVEVPEFSPLLGAKAVVFQGKLYAIGVNKTRKIQSFDGAAWQAEPSIPLLRDLASVTVYDSKIFVVGGCLEDSDCESSSWHPEKDVKNVLTFDGTEWSYAPSLFEPKDADDDQRIGSAPALAVLGDKLYAIGGESSYDDDTYFKGVQAFDGKAWSTVASLPQLGRQYMELGVRAAAWRDSLVVVPSNKDIEFVDGEWFNFFFDGEAWSCEACESNQSMAFTV